MGEMPNLRPSPLQLTFPNPLQKVAAVYEGYFTRKFPERAMALAAEIEATQPDLIGLQEAILLRTQSPPNGPATPATNVTVDFVQILLDALAARGLNYEVVVQATNFDAELPSALGFDVMFRGSFKSRKVTVVGEEVADRTRSGMWPSDHAGVVSKLRIPQP